MPCIAISGGFDGSPAASTWVRPNEVSMSDSVTGRVVAATAASYSWQYAARASSDRKAEIPAIAPSSTVLRQLTTLTSPTLALLSGAILIALGTPTDRRVDGVGGYVRGSTDLYRLHGPIQPT